MEKKELRQDPTPQKLITTDNNQRTQIEDVLPSFAMHNYMFNRTVQDVENDLSGELPPAYEALSDQSSGIEAIPADSMSSDFNSKVLNHLDDLQKIDLPIEVKIIVTEQPARMHQKPQRKPIPTEFKPGEMITGYISVKNCSKEVIPFEMFLVSLEGAVGTRIFPAGIDPQPQRRKVFMQNYDLSASYHPSRICLASSGPDEPGTQDKLDGSIYGFPEDRRMQPGVTYKKFFTFIAPFYTLDTTCPYQIPEHLVLPPSFGMDTSVHTGLSSNPLLFQAASDFYVDSVHGYTFRDLLPGSAMKVRDFSQDYQFVSYSIRAKLIGSNMELNKKNYESSSPSIPNFVFLKDIRRFIRINTSKPFGKFKVAHDCFPHALYSLSTKKQLKFFDARVKDVISKLKQDVKTQIDALEGSENSSDEHIVSSDAEIKKHVREVAQKYAARCRSSFDKSENLPTFSGEVCIPLADNVHARSKYSLSEKMTVSEGLIPRLLGSMNVTLYTSEDLMIRAIRPQNIQDNDQTLTYDNDAPPKYERNATTSECSMKSSSIFDEEMESCSGTICTSNSSISACSSLSKISNRLGISNPTKLSSHLTSIKLNFISVDLKFRPKVCNRKYLPPNSIIIRPRMIAIDIQSDKSLPVSIDSQYIREENFIGEKRKQLVLKYSNYRKAMCSLCQKLHQGVPADILYGVIAMTSIRQESTKIEDVFEPVKMTDLQWKFNVQEKCYMASFEFELKVSKKAIKKKYYLPPSFQTCSLGRWYQSDISIEVGRNAVNFNIPLKVY